MSELYWITTLGKLNTVCWILFALSIIILLIAIPCYFTCFDEDDIISKDSFYSEVNNTDFKIDYFSSSSSL